MEKLVSEVESFLNQTSSRRSNYPINYNYVNDSYVYGVFKRLLEFEEEQGDAKHVDAVKARAKAFVEKMQNGGEDEDMED